MGAIRRLATYIESVELEEADTEDVSVRIERLEEAWSCFNQSHNELLTTLSDSEATDLESELIEIEALYLKVKSALRRRIELWRHAEREQAEQQPQAQPQIAVQVQMPVRQQDIKNTWGEFDGSLTKWQGFHDRFVAAIHENSDVTPAFKFSYLKKSLTGKAARTMGEWQLTDDNYQEAWERLHQLYNRKYLICRELLRQFIRLPVLQCSPNSDELQKMSNVTHETLRQLRAQGIQIEHWDMIIVHMLHERLDAETGKQWELQRKSETPTTQEMLAFLDKQAGAASNEGGARARTASASSDRTAKPERFNRFGSERASKHSTGYNQTTSSNSTPNKKGVKTEPNATARRHECEICKGDHQLYSCEDFKALNLRSRKEFVLSRGLCENCLKRGHRIDGCFQGPCPRCPSRPKHNSLLCPTRDVNQTATVMHAEASPNHKRKVHKD